MFIFTLFDAIVTIVAIIAFFYLVHLTSHNRNILRAMYYNVLLETTIEKGNAIPYDTSKRMQNDGVISKRQRELLDKYSMEILKRKGQIDE